MARKNFSLHFNHNIWQIHAFSQGNHVVLEVRDSSAMQTYFSVIDLVQEKEVIADLRLPENWWVTVDQIIGDAYILFYSFETDVNIEPKEYYLYSIDEEKIVKHGQREEVLSSHILTQEKENNSLEIPFLYLAGSEYFDTVASFLKATINKEPVKAMNYLERPNEILIAYFVQRGKELQNELLATDKEGKIILQENLGNFNQGITDNTFFVKDNKLIFVKGVHDFFIYSLNP